MTIALYPTMAPRPYFSGNDQPDEIKPSKNRITFTKPSLENITPKKLAYGLGAGGAAFIGSDLAMTALGVNPQPLSIDLLSQQIDMIAQNPLNIFDTSDYHPVASTVRVLSGWAGGALGIRHALNKEFKNSLYSGEIIAGVSHALDTSPEKLNDLGLIGTQYDGKTNGVKHVALKWNAKNKLNDEQTKAIYESLEATLANKSNKYDFHIEYVDVRPTSLSEII